MMHQKQFDHYSIISTAVLFETRQLHENMELRDTGQITATTEHRNNIRIF